MYLYCACQHQEYCSNRKHSPGLGEAWSICMVLSSAQLSFHKMDWGFYPLSSSPGELKYIIKYLKCALQRDSTSAPISFLLRSSAWCPNSGWGSTFNTLFSVTSLMPLQRLRLKLYLKCALQRDDIAVASKVFLMRSLAWQAWRRSSGVSAEPCGILHQILVKPQSWGHFSPFHQALLN